MAVLTVKKKDDLIKFFNFAGSKYAMFSMKVTVSTVLRKYFLTTDMKMEDIRLGVDLLMRSIHGYKVKIYSRKNNSLSS